MKLLSRLLTTSSVFFICACSTATNDNKPVIANQCTEPRPQICTAEYLPVCATKTNNETKTYATGCTACGDPEVIHYRSGECE